MAALGAQIWLDLLLVQSDGCHDRGIAAAGAQAMKTFVIDEKSNITAHDGAESSHPGAEGYTAFSTQEELAALAVQWPSTRLLDIWNSIPGLTPVKKFTDRSTAVRRIWKAIQSLSAQPALTAPEGAAIPEPSKDPAANSRSGKRASSHRRVNSASQAGDSKKAQVIALLRQKGGATLGQIMAATEWQPHTVRGFLSGTLARRMGLTVESVKSADGQRVYSLSR
jgi:hypothetical protein